VLALPGNEVHGFFRTRTRESNLYSIELSRRLYLLRDNNVDMTIKDNSSGTWISCDTSHPHRSIASGSS